LVGDWAKKYDKMGEVPGDAFTRGEVVDEEIGVGISLGELAEPDDSPDETDRDRGRPRGNGEGMIGIGLEAVVFWVGVRLLFDMVR